jgi:hypothetical protein
MSSELKSMFWKTDINRFNRLKESFQNIKHPRSREYYRDQMLNIQAKWPNYIKLEEIPDL